MGGWWQREIIDAGKLPLLLCLTAFIITFLTTRFVTRMIRAGRGPFKDNVSSSGVHVHHAVPGIILLIVGAFMSVRLSTDESPWAEIAAVLVGVGTSLILDEFALILRLQDVYWSNEGRVSVELIGLAGACLGLVLIGISPFEFVDDVHVEAFGLRIVLSTTFILHGILVVVCVLKGKYRAALFGCFIPLIAWICGIRLARPRSMWARKFYRPERLGRATRRAKKFDDRWDPRWRWVSDAIAGRPSDENSPEEAKLPSDRVTEDDVRASAGTAT